MIRYLLLAVQLLPILLLSQSIAIQQGREYAAQLLKNQHLPGLGIAVSVGDSIVWAEGFGYADVWQKIPVTPSTQFRIGSLTKLLTAAAAAKLYEQQRLDLDTPVQQYVPSFLDKQTTITTRQLLGHLSGIRHYRYNEYINRIHYETIKHSLTLFENDPLLFQPGTQYKYSTYGYVLASAVIESASGKDFLKYMEEDVLEPLSLFSITPDYNDTANGRHAKPYGIDSLKNWVLEPDNDNSVRWGAGGFLSTASDMVRFASSMVSDKFLKPETRKIIFTPQKTSDGKETGVGLGWRVNRDSTGRVFYHHGGLSLGGRAFLLVLPGSKIAVVLFTNLTSSPLGSTEAFEVAKYFGN